MIKMFYFIVYFFIGRDETGFWESDEFYFADSELKELAQFVRDARLKEKSFQIRVMLDGCEFNSPAYQLRSTDNVAAGKYAMCLASKVEEDLPF